ncbi:hypothetical protein EVG20_g6836 [Dentipellis fragilis]|uniref:Uncharacterized protein n=1 Tax=Dentipellis fragilis TaxID=205917 RepID=A0A4Y9YK36_9AGAM|nr:hypothetical protein EVG20_g6836 [Dentipellis fragilis]
MADRTRSGMVVLCKEGGRPLRQFDRPVFLVSSPSGSHKIRAQEAQLGGVLRAGSLLRAQAAAGAIFTMVQQTAGAVRAIGRPAIGASAGTRLRRSHFRQKWEVSSAVRARARWAAAADQSGGEMPRSMSVRDKQEILALNEGFGRDPAATDPGDWAALNVFPRTSCPQNPTRREEARFEDWPAGLVVGTGGPRGYAGSTRGGHACNAWHGDGPLRLGQVETPVAQAGRRRVRNLNAAISARGAGGLLRSGRQDPEGTGRSGGMVTRGGGREGVWNVGREQRRLGFESVEDQGTDSFRLWKLGRGQLLIEASPDTARAKPVKS